MNLMYIVYEELRKQVKESAKEMNAAKRYYDTVQLIMHAEKMAREEGLIALDRDYGCLNEVFNCDNDFIELLQKISDGTDAYYLMDLWLTHYFVADLQGTDAVISLMKLVGGLAIQSGMRPNLLLEKLETMIPKKFIEDYRKFADAKDGEM